MTRDDIWIMFFIALSQAWVMAAVITNRVPAKIIAAVSGTLWLVAVIVGFRLS